MTTIITTSEQIEKAFAEWNRRFVNGPDKFQIVEYTDEQAKLSAEFFIKLLHEAV